MNFAHWKKITHPTSTTNILTGKHHRGADKYEIADCFITDIPEGTTKDAVIAKLIAKRFRYGGKAIEENDRLEFESEWPPEILRQFNSEMNSSKKWSWSALE